MEIGLLTSKDPKTLVLMYTFTHMTLTSPSLSIPQAPLYPVSSLLGINTISIDVHLGNTYVYCRILPWLLTAKTLDIFTFLLLSGKTEGLEEKVKEVYFNFSIYSTAEKKNQLHHYVTQ